MDVSDFVSLPPSIIDDLYEDVKPEVLTMNDFLNLPLNNGYKINMEKQNAEKNLQEEQKKLEATDRVIELNANEVFIKKQVDQQLKTEKVKFVEEILGKNN